MTTDTYALTHAQLSALQIAVNIAEERLEDPAAARCFSLSDIAAIRAAVDIVRCGTLFISEGLSEDQVRTDVLWERFWDEAGVDFCAWWRQEPEAMDPDNDDQPKGWVEFRDKGLAEMAAAAV